MKILEFSKSLEKSEIFLREEIWSYNKWVIIKRNSSEYVLDDNILLKKLFEIKYTKEEFKSLGSAFVDILYINSGELSKFSKKSFTHKYA